MFWRKKRRSVMTKCLKMMFYAALTLVFASPTQARVIHLYDLKNWEFFGSVEFGSSDIDGDENATCKSKGYLDKRLPDTECVTKRLSNGKYCYVDCKCSTSKFPWSITDTSFFAEQSRVLPKWRACPPSVALAEPGFDELVQVAVEHGGGVARLDAGAE
ncbi:MAG: hypothetical protein IKA30_00550, partial [Alphaproteobacteria bacterium]|nr:hypothetical protein [Alphaproteobacteria bacterium]